MYHFLFQLLITALAVGNVLYLAIYMHMGQMVCAFILNERPLLSVGPQVAFVKALASLFRVDSLPFLLTGVPTDELYYDLERLMEAGQAGSTKSIRRIGDCEAPEPIASAVYSGRRYAMELDDNSGINYSLRRDINFSE